MQQQRRIFGTAAIPALILGILAIKVMYFEYFWYHPFLNTFGLIVIFLILSKFVVAYFYQPTETSGYHPSLSVIIPAQEDLFQLKQTINASLNLSYIPDKVEFIVLHDFLGPEWDHCWEQIKEVDSRIVELYQEKNPSNERKRLAEAIRQSKGEVLIFIESGSMPDQMAAQYLSQSFKDQAVGAVCGNVSVYNSNVNKLTKMQDVLFFIVNSVFKASESVFDSVTYCVGGLSGFRRDYVMSILKQWEDGTFLGIRSDQGIFRSLTLAILKNHKVKYDSRAKARKRVSCMRQEFFQQQLNWQKGFWMENLKACSFMWYKHPATSYLFYIGYLVMLISPLVVIYNLVYQPIAMLEWSADYFGTFVLISTLISVYYFLNKENERWMYGYPLCVFCLIQICLQPIVAAILTLKQVWLKV